MKRMLTFVCAFSFLMSCTTTPHQSSNSAFSKMQFDNIYSSYDKKDARTVAADGPGEVSSVRLSSDTDFIAEIRTPGNSILDRIKRDAVTKLSNAKFEASASRMQRIFTAVRARPRDFFAQLRSREPIFVSEGALGSGFLKEFKGKALVPNVYIVTKYKDVKEVLDNNEIFTVAPYKKAMDATVGDAYMLGRDGDAANREKPAMRHALTSGFDKQKTQERVRAIVKSLALRGISAGSKKGQLDIVKDVTRFVPLGVNDEYFGFNGPTNDPKAMARWSEATQHAFFHNPFQEEDVFNASVTAGKEMNEYIKNILVPVRKAELENGRPAIDTVSQIIVASKTHAKHGLDEARIVANVIGLLVGSVETTSAAITQTMDVILSNPQLLEYAASIAKSGTDAEMNQIVWEALRFAPVNPWLGRFSTEDYTLGKGTSHETVIKNGSLVLASTHSAMFDEDVFPEPNQFKLGRDLKNYWHLGYGNHRCLGDDISLVMVPETVKQLLLLPGLKAVSNKPLVREPFPETLLVSYDSKASGIKEAPDKTLMDTVETVTGFLGLGGFVAETIYNMDKRKEAIKAIPAAIKGKPEQKRQAIKILPSLVVDATKKMTSEQKLDRCLNTNPKSKEAFADPVDRAAYCNVTMDFRGCYFVQRLLGKQSSYASYYHCAYAGVLTSSNGVDVYKPSLTPKEIEDFKASFKHLDNFSFLNLEY